MARVDAHDDRYRQSILSVIRDATGLCLIRPREIRNALGDMTRDCARLVRITPYALSELSRRYEAFLAGKESWSAYHAEITVDAGRK